MKDITLYRNIIIWTVIFSLVKIMMGQAQVEIHPEKSVNSLLQQLKEGASQIEFLLQKTEQLEDSLPELALIYAKRALELSKKHQKPFAEAKSLYWTSLLQVRRNTYNDALEIPLRRSQVASELFRKEGNPFWLTRAHNLLATIYFNRKEDREASLQAQLALDALQKAHESDEKMSALAGDTYYTKGKMAIDSNPDSARAWFHKSREQYKQARNQAGIAKTEIGLAFSVASDQKKDHFIKAIDIYTQLNYRQYLQKALLEYGIHCINQYEDSRGRQEHWIKIGIQVLQEALEMEQGNRCENRKQLGIAYHWKAFFHQEEEWLFLLYVDSASYYYQQAVQEATEEGNFECVHDIAEEIAESCESVGNCPEAIVDIAESLNAILQIREKEIVRAEQEIYEYQQREHEVQVGRERFTIILIGLILLLGALVTFYFFYQRQRIRHLNRKLEAEREAAIARENILKARRAASRAQMNPHFISNTLNAIDNLVNFGRRDDASHYLIQFDRLCHQIIEYSRAEEITLLEEIETLKNFLSLEHLRMEDMLNYQIDIDPKLNLETISIPPLLLQPFVENAIWHGIKNKQAPGNLEIQIRKKGEKLLECTIEDDGVGREKAKALEQRSVMKRPSFGMTITQERIEAIDQLKGADFEIIDLYDENKKASGTRVVITLQLQTVGT